MLWWRRSRPDGSGTEHPKVKVHTTFWGGQYVNAEELMRHPDVVAAVKRFSDIIGPIIAREQQRLRAEREARLGGPDKS